MVLKYKKLITFIKIKNKNFNTIELHDEEKKKFTKRKTFALGLPGIHQTLFFVC
jgi:hypothetical protein